jgi:DNA repair and recombination protein RAD54B
MVARSTRILFDGLPKMNKSLPSKPPIEYFSVMYRLKPSAKKHQTWDFDGFLSVDQDSFCLLDSDGKLVSKSRNSKTVEEGAQLVVGGKELEVQGRVSTEEFDKVAEIKGGKDEENAPPANKVLVKPATTIKPFYSSFKSKSTAAKGSKPFAPRFDPLKPGAVVMPKLTDTTNTVDVVIDPHISSKLKDHQKSGIQFLYSSVMGITNPNQLGCILADVNV